MKIQPGEELITGKWILEEGQVVADDACRRIGWLLTHCLQKVVTDSPRWGAWESLFKDPSDGRYWERTYPSSEMHGGGPPQLRCLEDGEAKLKYGLD